VNLGQALVDAGLLTDEQLVEATNEQEEHGGSLGKILMGRGFVAEKDLVRTFAGLIGHEFVDLEESDVDAGAVTLIEEKVMTRHGAIPIRFDGEKLVVAMHDPSNMQGVDDLRAMTKRDIVPVIATKTDVLAAIKRYSSMADEMEQIADDIAGVDDDDLDLSQLKTVTDDAPIVKFVNLLISQAVADGVSDIHIEPGEKDLRVRYRIDGVLHEVMTQPRNVQSAIISRLKIMAEVDIAERRVPQDGRFSVTAAGKQVDMRFSTLPTVYGEKIVMRILDTSSVMLSLDDLGFLEHNLKVFRESYTKPYGLILVCGPTGSGKSTTLYATLNVVNSPGVNIVTTEDPVEYRLAGINQVQVNSKVGLTFAGALRSILRQDPDIVLVGEMRDPETAHIGIEAALTGHLVLSTLHTNNAPSAITRLTEMGIEPFLVASSVDCVLAQRLARKVCGKCVEMVRPEAVALETAGFSQDIIDERPEIPKAVGCKHCSDTGYRGRIAVHEVMAMSEEIERHTVARASSEDITRTAREQGMRTLREDGLAKVLLGRTTIEEVGRVVV
jgi:type IV pilus assembly protein PilB